MWSQKGSVSCILAHRKPVATGVTGATRHAEAQWVFVLSRPERSLRSLGRLSGKATAGREVPPPLSWLSPQRVPGIEFGHLYTNRDTALAGCKILPGPWKGKISDVRGPPGRLGKSQGLQPHPPVSGRGLRNTFAPALPEPAARRACHLPRSVPRSAHPACSVFESPSENPLSVFPDSTPKWPELSRLSHAWVPITRITPPGRRKTRAARVSRTCLPGETRRDTGPSGPLAPLLPHRPGHRPPPAGHGQAGRWAPRAEGALRHQEALTSRAPAGEAQAPPRPRPGHVDPTPGPSSPVRPPEGRARSAQRGNRDSAPGAGRSRAKPRPARLCQDSRWELQLVGEPPAPTYPEAGGEVKGVLNPSWESSQGCHPLPHVLKKFESGWRRFM